MNDLQKMINAAFELISSIPVKENAVEVMAAAKEHLRQAYKMAETEVTADGGQDDRGA